MDVSVSTCSESAPVRSPASLAVGTRPWHNLLFCCRDLTMGAVQRALCVVKNTEGGTGFVHLGNVGLPAEGGHSRDRFSRWRVLTSKKITPENPPKERFIWEKKKETKLPRSVYLYTRWHGLPQPAAQVEKGPETNMAPSFICIPPREVTTEFNRKSRRALTRSPAPSPRSSQLYG